MTAVVRLALARPYTFVVMAILVVLFSALSALRTAADIFPISAFRSSRLSGIPVCRRMTCRAGSSPPMNERFRLRNDIEHIESQSLPGVGVVKIYFQPNVNISAAQAQVTSVSQTILKQLPQGVTPPIILVYNASSVPIIQLALSSEPFAKPLFPGIKTESDGARI
jgi:multidrug efflux pump subunit AcrB